MSNEMIARPQAFQAMTTDLQVSMDDVVSAFVSQYETNLFTRKDELSKTIKGLEKEASDNHEALLDEVNGSQWEGEKLPFGMTYKVSDGAVNWKGKEVSFSIEVKGPKQGYYANTVSIKKASKIPAKFLKTHKKIEDQLSELRSELSDVLMSLKQVTRKERQVRGRIAMRKLEDSGYASLMQDAELIKLVQLEE